MIYTHDFIFIGLIPVKVECQKKLDNTTSDVALCPLPKPDVSPTKECDAGVCPEKYIWKEKYSSCSVTCGGGISLISKWWKLFLLSE